MAQVYNLILNAQSDSLTVTHNLNTSAILIRILSDSGVAINEVIGKVIIDQSDPRNKLSIIFNNSVTGRLQVITDDYLKVSVAEGFITSSSFASTTDPTTANNLTQGYTAGSSWLNTTTQDLFICVASTSGTATWAWQPTTTKHIRLTKTSTQTFNTSFTKVTWNTSSQTVNDYFTYSNNNITILKSGFYRLSYNITASYSQNNSSSTARYAVTKNTSFNIIQETAGYFMAPRSNVLFSGCLESEVPLVQGDILSLYCQMAQGGGTLTVQSSNTYFRITRIG